MLVIKPYNQVQIFLLEQVYVLASHQGHIFELTTAGA